MNEDNDILNKLEKNGMGNTMPILESASNLDGISRGASPHRLIWFAFGRNDNPQRSTNSQQNFKYNANLNL
ncbi:hypothetical protein AVEN_51923-1, partial [Araneus ventricosus]